MVYDIFQSPFLHNSIKNHIYCSILLLILLHCIASSLFILYIVCVEILLI